MFIFAVHLEINLFALQNIKYMEKELWKDVVGYEGYYKISNLGRVKSIQRFYTDILGRRIPVREKMIIIKISKNTGYPFVGLSKNGRREKKFIHRMIAEAFIPNPKNLPCVNHIDQDRSNSVLSNLEWCSYSYNNTYGNANKKRKETLRKNLTGKHKIIYQFTKNGELVRIYAHGVKQFQEELGFEIQDCLTGKSKTSNGFVFSYNNCFAYIEDLPKKHQKYVYLIDDEGKIVEKYKSVSEAARNNSIERHCFSRTQSIDGIITIGNKMFIVEKKENEYIPKGHKGSRPDLIGKGTKPVSQYTKEGKYVQSFNSTKEAAIFIGNVKYAPDITNCCKGKIKTAYGFMWTYKDAPKPNPFMDKSVRIIKQYSINGEYIATYNSIKEAAIAIGNGKPGSIANNLKGISHSAFGYIWKYAND